MAPMAKYRDDAAALERLVEADRVHRDVYTDPEVFQLEMERLWSRTRARCRTRETSSLSISRRSR